jgi:hypothetical protein
MAKYAIMSGDDIYYQDYNKQDVWTDIGGADYDITFGNESKFDCSEYTLFDTQNEAEMKVAELRVSGYEDELIVWKMEEVVCYKFDEEV